MEPLRERTFAVNTEIIITFFTDRYYNRIYSIAQDDFTRNGGTSITDTYARIVKIYLSSIEQSGQELRETINALHVYYCKYAGECTLGGLIASIVAQIIPDEFFSTMDDRERDAVFRDLVKQIDISMGKRVMKVDLLRNVIDERKNFETGVGVLRGEGEKVIRDFKASLIAKLYSKNDNKDRAMRVVAAEHFDKVRKELVTALTEVCTLQVENERLKEELNKGGKMKDAVIKRNSEIVAFAKDLQEKLTASQIMLQKLQLQMQYQQQQQQQQQQPTIITPKPSQTDDKVITDTKLKKTPAHSPSPPLPNEPTDEEIDHEIAIIKDGDIDDVDNNTDDFARDDDESEYIDTHAIAQLIAKNTKKNSS
jgi:regulator of replication initiation timing